MSKRPLTHKGETRLKKKTGALIRKIRKARGLTQVPFARRIGVTQGYLSKLEKGEIPPRLYTAIRISKKFGVPMDAWEGLV